jgi:L-seryl-tRNA(Ser) seleniumtransferase
VKEAERTNTEDKAERSEAQSYEALYRMLPAVHELLAERASGNGALHERERRVLAIRRVLSKVRGEIARNMHSEATLRIVIDQLPGEIDTEIQRGIPYSLRRLINATGVILHTNLGRAPLSRTAVENVSAVAAGYSNLEFDLERGERGRRDAHVEAHLLALLGETIGKTLNTTHGAIVVNNCAAATFLVLHALARGKQVIVSRSELVEIGGGFRIPEILEQSGAVLREVGTTNRTRIADYERAIAPETGLILRVHQSNFAMEGFVERPITSELVQLGKRTQIAVFEDQGTGLIEALEPYGICGEPTLTASVAAGCDVVAASGDKLLGGPQCGILIGRRELIERIRQNPLYRAFRVDKLSYAALEATLIDYLRADREAVPVFRMLRTTEAEIRRRCEQIVAQIQSDVMVVELTPVDSIVGGGTAPRSKLASHAIALRHEHLSAEELLANLRRLGMPIVGRIDNDCVLLDLRTVEPELDQLLASSLQHLAEASSDAARI